MKKLLTIMLIISIILISSCTRINLATGTAVRILTPEQILTAVPSGFQYVSDAGNGWHFLKHESGKYLVSIQGYGGDGTFVQMTWIGD